MAPPQWDVAVAPSSTLGATSYPSFWVSIAKRTMRQASSQVGKQYELDAGQTGEFHPILDNRDAAFSPVNTSSPYSPNVAAFKPVRWRAQYPATPNVLTVDQATSGSLQAAGPIVDTVVPVWISYGFFWNVRAEVDAYTGPNVFHQVISPAQTAPFAAADMNGWSVIPGAQHSAQAVMRATAGGTTPQARLTLIWRDASGGTISAVNGGTVTLTANSRVWQQITVSGQAPANAAGASLQIQMVNSVAVTWQASGFQVEYAAAPTSWATPGTWYPMFFGGAERWPQIYGMQGTFGQTQPVVVDAFALLSNMYPLPAFYNEVLALNPDFFFPLDDPTGATVFRDLTGKHNPAQLGTSPYGSGTIAAGQSVQSATANGAFLGSPGPVVTMTNPDTGTLFAQVCSWIDLTKAGANKPPASGGWTRMIAFRNNGAATVEGTLWVSAPSAFASRNQLFYVAIRATPNSSLAVGVFGPTSGASYNPPAGSFADNNWHLLHITQSANGSTLNIYVDAVNVFTTTLVGDQHPTLLDTDMVGALASPGDGQFYQGYNGDVGFVAQWPSTLTPAQISNMYSTWRPGASPESSDARYKRILSYAGWLGAVAATPGATTAMGPATDIDGRTDALTLLQNVVTTESGTHYVGPDGTITVEPRTSRYNKLTPTYTFGENVLGGEWPYEDVAFDFDTTHVVGQAQITQNSTGQVFIANASSTLAPNYRPTYQRTINVVNPQECVDAASYLANRNANPRLRVQKIRLHPAALAGLWPIALALRISTRVRVMRRTPGAPTIQFDGFIESVKWAVDWDNGDAFVDLEISPADLQLYWVNAALHTTSRASMSSGTNSITLNPIPGESVNPFPVCSGLRLTLDPGGALAETLTVLSVAGGIPLAPNGSFVVDTSGWLGSNSATMAQSLTAGPGYPQGPLSAVTITSTQNVSASGLQAAAAQSGFAAASVYLFQAWVKPSATSTFTTNVDWYNVSSVYVSTTTVTVSNVQGGQWTQLATSHTAPATATKGIMYVLGGIMPVAATFAITDIFVGLPPTVTFTANAANTHTSGITVCEALPAGITDPTTWDTAALIGVSTTPSY